VAQAPKPPADPRPDADEPGPGQSVRIRLHEDAERVRRAVRLLSHGVAAGVLAVHLLATASLTWIVLSHPVPHPLMYPLMGLVLWLVLTMRFTALLTGRNRSAALALFFTTLLHAFWIAVLVDQVPERPVFAGNLVHRPPLWLLGIPMALYLAALAGTVVHGIFWRRHRRLSEGVDAGA
jgi:hypothetical protein